MTLSKAQQNNFYSFIIPVYNVADYLDECLQSILVQTYKNWEIVLIDDKSTDGSLDICQKYANLHKNIRVVCNKCNIGLAATRNVGLEHANGDWIIFIDSDDYINNKDFLKSIDSQTDKSDTVFYGYTIFEDKSNKIIGTKFVNISEINILKNNKDKINFLFKSKNWCWSAWTHAYRSEFLKNNNLNFNSKMRQAEDCDFFYRAMVCNPSISAINSSCYMYRQRQKSLTQSPADTTKYGVMATIQTAETVKNSKIEKTYKNALLNTISYNYITTLINIQKNLKGQEKKSELQKLKKITYLNNYSLNLKTKIPQLILRIFGINIGSWLIENTYKVIKN